MPPKTPGKTPGRKAKRDTVIASGSDQSVEERECTRSTRSASRSSATQFFKATSTPEATDSDPESDDEFDVLNETVKPATTKSPGCKIHKLTQAARKANGSKKLREIIDQLLLELRNFERTSSADRKADQDRWQQQLKAMSARQEKEIYRYVETSRKLLDRVENLERQARETSQAAAPDGSMTVEQEKVAPIKENHSDEGERENRGAGCWILKRSLVALPSCQKLKWAASGDDKMGQNRKKGFLVLYDLRTPTRQRVVKTTTSSVRSWGAKI
uniref:Uncharacterized protein n=1 Tax=Anopheles atroparvus TaxID=41427 RepID=A0A182J2K3_ANOAO